MSKGEWTPFATPARVRRVILPESSPGLCRFFTQNHFLTPLDSRFSTRRQSRGREETKRLSQYSLSRPIECTDESDSQRGFPDSRSCSPRSALIHRATRMSIHSPHRDASTFNSGSGNNSQTEGTDAPGKGSDDSECDIDLTVSPDAVPFYSDGPAKSPQVVPRSSVSAPLFIQAEPARPVSTSKRSARTVALRDLSPFSVDGTSRFTMEVSSVEDLVTPSPPPRYVTSRPSRVETHAKSPATIQIDDDDGEKGPWIFISTLYLAATSQN